MKRVAFFLWIFIFNTTINIFSQTSQGTIAYIRDNKEIRLIQPDGSNDRLLWAHPRPEHASTQGIKGLSWRRDSSEIAFTSGHEAVYSIYQSDIYTIGIDGKKLRRVTNAPSPSEFARLPKGTVKVTVRNPNTFGDNGSMSVFIIYVAGAKEPQTATVPPGKSQTLTFTNVADLGRTNQGVVAMNGPFRWFIPGVDVKAGAIAQTTLSIIGPGTRDLEAFGPVWRADGKQIGYWNGRIWHIPANANASTKYEPLMPGDQPPGVSGWDWGPTPALSNQVIYASALTDGMITGEYGIYMIPGGTKGRGVKLAEYVDKTSGETAMLSDLQWLPDGSGFIFAKESVRSSLVIDANNSMSVKKFSGSSLMRYDIATKKLSLIKELDGKYVNSFSVSPDGQWLVLEFGNSFEDRALSMTDPKRILASELWIMRINGSELRQLVKNGSSPGWGR